jgi:hypothetical protein
MKNRGGVGYAPHLVLSAWLPQRVLSVAEISESMANAVASAKQSPPYNGQQIEADQEVWVPVNGLPVDPTAWNIREGKTHFCAFIVLGFRNDTLRERATTG